MAWFTEDVATFLGELAENNNREWFEANKKRYEKSVKEPMKEFAGEMIVRMQTLDPSITMLPKDAVFRIHRDTRFSKNKAPYKTNAAMVVSAAGRGHHSYPGLYFHVDAQTVAIASGCYFLEPAELQKVRTHIMENPDEFVQLINDKEFLRVFGGVKGEKNKILPQEFREAAVAQPLLFNKQFFYWAEYAPEELLRDDLADFVMEHVRAARPLNEFLIAGLKR